MCIRDRFCVNPENQAKWNAMTGYFPINVHAQETDTFKALSLIHI